MRKVIRISALAAAALALVGAQESRRQAAPSASQEDVRKLEQELRRMRQEALELERKSSARSSKERQKALEESKAAIAAAERKLAERMESIAREARQRSDDQLRTQRTVWYVSLAAVLAGLGFVAYFLKRNRGQPGFAAQSETRPGALLDPDIGDLKEFSSRNNGIKKISFILSLRDGRRFNCMAEMRDGLDPLVYIERDPVPVAWDKRRQKAAKLAASPEN